MKLGGNHLCRKSSYIDILQQVYPDYNWLPWQFDKSPRNFWNDPKNTRKYMDWISTQLNVKDMDDWYKVSYKACSKNSTILIYRT